MRLQGRSDAFFRPFHLKCPVNNPPQFPDFCPFGGKVIVALVFGNVGEGAEMNAVFVCVVGMAGLPNGIPVEIEAIIEIED